MKLRNETLEIDYYYGDEIPSEARRFLIELNLVNAGENGMAVELPQNISIEIQRKINESYAIDGFNSFVSDLVSVKRKLPDTRPDECKRKNYESLPKASIILIFHNEAWSLLLRTINSILSQTSKHIIEEIILVDDASDRKHLQKPLEDYIKKFPEIKLIRSPLRVGVSGVRSLGALNARGPILVYVDSHIEMMPFWLEPLLERFKFKKNVIAYPTLSSINSDNLMFDSSFNVPKVFGGLNWKMQFRWIDIELYEGNNSSPPWDAKRSPTALGGTFAISKDFLLHVGLFDPGFYVYGGEDIEISLKAWLCGDGAEFVPCSKVGHVYKNHVYTVIKYFHTISL